MNHMALKYEGMADKFRTMGHPVRVAILEMLFACNPGKLTVKSIYENLGIDQPSTSRHLNIMRRAGVLARTREAGSTFYCLCVEDPYVKCLTKCFI